MEEEEEEEEGRKGRDGERMEVRREERMEGRREQEEIMEGRREGDGESIEGRREEEERMEGTIERRGESIEGRIEREEERIEERREGEKQKKITENKTPSPTTTTTTTITTINSSSYDVIILSLLLEYLPSPYQRYQCCEKAYQILSPNGILAIITPDSKHQGANSILYQLWRVTLANLGFIRVRYDKQSHFHGLVFRKSLSRAVCKLDSIRFLNNAKKTSLSVRDKLKGIDYDKVMFEMYIPQDFVQVDSCVKKRKRSSRRIGDDLGKKRRKEGGMLDKRDIKETESVKEEVEEHKKEGDGESERR